MEYFIRKFYNFKRLDGKEKLETQIIDDFMVLGHAVPVEIKEARKSICTAGYSPSKGLVRLYPVPINVRPQMWEVIKIPVERNTQDVRSESWKIQNSKKIGIDCSKK